MVLLLLPSCLTCSLFLLVLDLEQRLRFFQSFLLFCVILQELKARKFVKEVCREGEVQLIVTLGKRRVKNTSEGRREKVRLGWPGE